MPLPKSLQKSTPADHAVQLLKARWFKLASKEDYPKTAKLTAELDQLETSIRKLMTENR